MSDRLGNTPLLETRMDDARAVMDAAGSSRAAFFGSSEGAAMSLLFAARYPELAMALCPLIGEAVNPPAQPVLARSPVLSSPPARGRSSGLAHAALR